MNSNRRRGVVFWLPLVLLLLATWIPVTAQVEDEDEDDGWGNLYFEFGTWVAQPSGLGYEPATAASPTDPFNRDILGFKHGTETGGRYRMAFELSRNVGTITLSYFAHEAMDSLEDFRPGQFVIGQTLTSPTFAGFGNDGLSDGVRADARTALRDIRIDFSRTAFQTDRAQGTWFVGWRRVVHKRNQETDYFALAPLFPPLVPPVSDPRPDLAPRPETAFANSRFEGRGPEAGMDFLFPLKGQGRLSLESGFAVSILRGEIDADWGSNTWAYFFDDPFSGQFVQLFPPYDIFGQIVPNPDPMLPDFILVDFISQVPFFDGTRDDGRSANGMVLETYLGLRFEAWRDLEIFGGFRSTHYGDVGLDIRRQSSVITTTARSATYEGFYGGLSYRF